MTAPAEHRLHRDIFETIIRHQSDSQQLLLKVIKKHFLQKTTIMQHAGSPLSEPFNDIPDEKSENCVSLKLHVY